MLLLLLFFYQFYFILFWLIVYDACRMQNVKGNHIGRGNHKYFFQSVFGRWFTML